MIKTRTLFDITTFLLFLPIFANAGGPIMGQGPLPLSAHWPKDGDRLTKVKCEYKDMPVDTSVWDFSDICETRQNHDVLWRNLGDTLLVRAEKGEQTVYRCICDSIYLVSAEDALIRMSAQSSRALVWPERRHNISDTASRDMVYSGIFSGGNTVATKGEFKTTVLGMGCLILPMDTLYNVKRIRTEKTEAVNIESSQPDSARQDSCVRPTDPIFHTVITDRWYSEYYRYELIENITETYTADGKNFVREKSTYLMSPELQEYALGIKRPVRNRPSVAIKGDKDSRTGPPLPSVNFSFDYDGKSVRINGLCSTDCGDDCNTSSEVSLLLYDPLGRVRQHLTVEIDQGCWSHVLQTEGLPTGTYLITVSLDGQIQSYKFTVR